MPGIHGGLIIFWRNARAFGKIQGYALTRLNLSFKRNSLQNTGGIPRRASLRGSIPERASVWEVGRFNPVLVRLASAEKALEPRGHARVRRIEDSLARTANLRITPTISEGLSVFIGDKQTGNCEQYVSTVMRVGGELAR